MPRKPKKPCAYPGCSKLTEGTYCEEHQKLMAKQYEQNDRDPLHSKRYGRSWQKIRSAYVAAHPLCERCARAGRYVPVEEVHHIVPLRDGGTNAPSNLMSLCRKCHAEIHAEMGDRRTWKQTQGGGGLISVGEAAETGAPSNVQNRKSFRGNSPVESEVMKNGSAGTEARKRRKAEKSDSG